MTSKLSSIEIMNLIADFLFLYHKHWAASAAVRREK
jgi:hypothetical protein